MSIDLLSDVLRAVRLRGAVFYAVQGHSPWTAEAPPARDILPRVMPAADHLIEFHGIIRGTAWASIVGHGEPIRLDAQDVILFPQGDPHVLSSSPGLRPTRPQPRPYLPDAPGPHRLPYVLSLHGQEATLGHQPTGPGDEETLVVCGFLGLDARPFNPLLASLPRILRVPGSALGADSWVTAFLRTAALETGHGGPGATPGSGAVLERMSEMLFVEVLRRHVAALPEGETGWLAGIHDPVVGPALARMHERPGDPWTLETLADAVAISRSGLHERFASLIGQPPMQYLTRWRMQVASGRLRDGGSTIADVAGAVGYESEAAFSRAFKRVVGVAPSTLRSRREVAVG